MNDVISTVEAVSIANTMNIVIKLRLLALLFLNKGTKIQRHVNITRNEI